MSDSRAPAPGADTAAPPQAPEDVVLHGRPRPVTRLNRGLLLLIAAILLAAILGAGLAVLPVPKRQGGPAQTELYSSGHKPMPDRMAALPSSYGELPPPAAAPPPGRPAPAGPPQSATPHLQPPAPLSDRLDPQAQAALAERQRQARQAQQAREAAVFFRISARRQESAAGSAAPAAGTGEAAAGRLALDPPRDQNLQQRKLDFLAARGDAATAQAHRLQDPLSPYQLMAGSVIAASLVSGINSDLPGIVKAQVTENVFDTVSGRHLLIPQGSQLIGRYDSVIAFGQSRALVVWQRIIMPDGASIVVDNLPAADTAGYAGLADGVDYHSWRLIGGVALSTLLGVGTELSFGDDEGELVRAVRESVQQNANRAGQRIIERNLDIQPTITVRPGWPLRVIVHKDLILRPYRQARAAGE